MKNFKLKSILFSLTAVVMVTMFLSSCEKDTILNDQPSVNENFTTDNAQLKNAPGIILPEEITKGGDEVIQEYVNSISKDELANHINDFVISDFLSKKNKSEHALNSSEISSFNDIDLSEYLSENEEQELNKRLVKPSEIQSRHCFNLYCYSYTYYSSWCGCWLDRYVYCRTVCT